MKPKLPKTQHMLDNARFILDVILVGLFAVVLGSVIGMLLFYW